MRDWIQGSSEWLSIGQISNGNSYGISENLMFSFPSLCSNGVYEKIADVNISDVLNDYIKITEQELIQERDSVLDLL